MTEIERKALELVNEIEREEIYKDFTSIHKKDIILNAALHRAIERHEAFRQEVSDALVNYFGEHFVAEDGSEELARFIIPKPDPLEEIIKRNYAGSMSPSQIAYAIRKELDERGLEIREKSDG